MYVSHVSTSLVIDRSVTVFVDDEAEFVCSTRDSTLSWEVNDNISTGDFRIDVETNAGFYIITLIVNARTEYNGTKASCVDGNRITIAYLHIQGMYMYIHCTVMFMYNAVECTCIYMCMQVHVHVHVHCIY